MSAKPGADRGYKRSWKNLLINKRYQLRFTLFMVALAGLLMLGLGIWVMRVANETTTVSMASVRGEACPKVPSLGNGAANGDDEDAVPAPSMKLDEAPDGPAGDSPAPASGASPGEPSTAGPPAPTAAADDHGAKADGAKADRAKAGADAADQPEDETAHRVAHQHRPRTPVVDDEPRHVQVQIDESSMTLTQAVPPNLADRIVAHWTCELRQAATFDRLERGRMRILWAMIATGVMLVLGLAIYGIKMTHRVAGPLFKVSLYLSKMRAGRFDKVYNLRKGDQLVDFYDHFKHAHGGIVQMQRDDIARIAAVVSAAEAAGAGAHPAVAELREMLERKEKSIE
ncbi:MAG TPA: hypothetical protein VLM79_25800 [Kofleriaceae bacterium]|nr:hypothetical protein [Kofleriaceae bacterium]